MNTQAITLSKKPLFSGKVREIYPYKNDLLIMTTNRMTAFDRYLCDVPHKGEVLTQLSAWWFENTRHIIPNHFLNLENENTMHVKKCTPLPIEIIVRGYITGSTNTAIWTRYQKGERQFFDSTLPDGLNKNDPLPTPIITPTTKSDSHDEPLTPDTMHTVVSPDIWQSIKTATLALFNFGQEKAKEKGFILVDTKYEFGFDDNNKLLLIDECHTPDSSRFWKIKTYDSYDKELMRLWFREHCDPYHDKILPTPPISLVEETAFRYQSLYETLTNQPLRKKTCAASSGS